LPSCSEKIALEISDTGCGKIAAITSCDETDLAIEVKDIVADGCCSKQDKLLTLLTELAMTVVGGEDTFDVLIALRVAVAKIVTLVN
jgi:hypothetical protein